MDTSELPRRPAVYRCCNCFLPFSVLVANPEKTDLHGRGQSRLWPTVQGKYITKREILAVHPPPPTVLILYCTVIKSNNVLYCNQVKQNKIKCNTKRVQQRVQKEKMVERTPRDASTCLGATRRVQQRERKEEMARRRSRDASTCLGATQASVRLGPVQDSFGLPTISRRIGVASQVLRFRIR